MTVKRVLHKLLRESAAVSVIEFALVLPVFMTLGMYGAEIAWMNAAALEASQVASTLADNASRLGQTDNSGVTPTITGNDINSVLTGALEEGSSINLTEDGRVILSSLETHKVTGKQYLHWQQCKGNQTGHASKHGKPDQTGSAIAAIASGGKIGKTVITAPPGSSVMIAEVWYQYRALFGTMFVKPIMIYEQAAVIVRDNRNLDPGISSPKAANAC